MAISRAVLVASFVAAFLVAGTAVALLVTNDRPMLAGRSGDEHDHACGGPLFTLRKLEPAVEDTGVEDGEHRTVTYTLRPDGLEGGVVHVCTSVGDVRIVPASDDLVTLTFTIRAQDDGTAADVRDAKVEAIFAADDGGLSVTGWHVDERRRDDEVHVDVELALPESGTWSIDAATGVGDLLVERVLAGSLDLSTGVGDVVAGTETTEDVHATTGVGDIRLDLGSVGAGAVTASTGVGEIAIDLPLRADVGYDATAQTGVGDIDLDLGPTEEKSSDRTHVGGSERARSEGYADKPTKVVVTASTGTGDIGVHAS